MFYGLVDDTEWHGVTQFSGFWPDPTVQRLTQNLTFEYHRLSSSRDKQHTVLVFICMLLLLFCFVFCPEAQAQSGAERVGLVTPFPTRTKDI